MKNSIPRKLLSGILVLLLYHFPIHAAQDSTLNIQAKVDFYQNKTQKKELPRAERLTAFDSLIVYLEKAGKSEQANLKRLEYAELLSSAGNNIAAFHVYEDALYFFNSPNETSNPEDIRNNRIKCLYELGRTTMLLGLYPSSVEYFFQVLEQDNSNSGFSIRAYSYLALLFNNLHQEKQAINYISMATKELNERTDLDKKSAFVYYNNLSGLYYIQQKYDSSVLSMKKAEQYLETEADRSVWNYNMGNIYLSIGETALAKEYLQQIVHELDSSTDISYSHVSSLVNLGYMETLEKNYPEALSFYQKAVELSRKIGTRRVEAQAYSEMSAVYEALHNDSKALSLLRKGVALRDSLFNSDQMENINLLSHEYLQKEKKLEMDLLQKQLQYEKLSNKHKNMVLTILWILLIIFSLCFLVALYNWKKQKIDSQAQKKGFENQNHELNIESDKKAQQISTARLQLVQASEIISECRNELRKIRFQKDSDKKETLLHLEEILASFNLDSAWEEFELSFNQIHRSFFTRLQEKHPELTRSEQRICALIVLNFSNKEIANITHRSVRTIEATTYQIRKKTGVPSSTKTLTYLQSFLSE